MKIHHLNCATMCPPGGGWIDGNPGLLRSGRLVCHCLLLEGEDGLTLVDTGLGTEDVSEPSRRLGAAFTLGVRPRLMREETALAQVERLGFRASDVAHIILTHLDPDHAGGISDFPNAEIHVFDAEHAAAMEPATLNERNRYRPAQWEHGPLWRLHGAQGEKWCGFDSVEAAGGCLLIPLHGHTRGHCGVAVPDGSGWLIHCGDAYFFRGEVETPPTCPPGLRIFQGAMQVDGVARRHNQFLLRNLASAHGDDVRLFSAHDATEYERYARSA